MQAQSVRRRILALIRQHGGLRKAARALGVDHGNLYRVAHGLRQPSAEILSALGLVEERNYRSSAGVDTDTMRE